MYKWRQQQEAALRAEKGSGMTPEQVQRFVDGCKIRPKHHQGQCSDYHRLPGLRVIYNRAQAGRFQRKGSTASSDHRIGTKCDISTAIIMKSKYYGRNTFVRSLELPLSVFPVPRR